MVKVKVITVRHSDGRSRAIPLDLDDDLTATRKKLIHSGIMSESDVFIYVESKSDTDTPEEAQTKSEGSTFDRSSEEGFTLDSFLDGQTVLKIGTSFKPFDTDRDMIDYTMMNDKQKIVFLTTGISNINVFNGMSVEADSSGKGKLVRKFRRPYTLTSGSRLYDIKSPREFDFESLLTFSEESHTMQTSGVNSTSISLTTPWVSAEASYEEAKKNSSSNSKVRTYLTERRVCNKIVISIDAKQMTPNDKFVKAVKAAFDRKLGVDKYEALIGVLNEWGWYVPLEFTLGSAIYATKVTEASSFEQAKEENNKFSASFKVEFAGYGGGAGHSEGNSSGSTDTNTSKGEHMTFHQIGGHAIGQDDLTGWNDSLNDARTWNVISYKKLYPTLMILSDVESEMFNEFWQILMDFNSFQEVKNLQKFISVSGYAFQIAKLVASKDELDYSTMDNEKKLAYLSGKTSKINVFNGLSMEADLSGSAKLVRKFRKLYKLRDGSLPYEMKPRKDFDYNPLVATSLEENWLFSSGVPNDDYIKCSLNQTKVNGGIRLYLTMRYEGNKTILFIDPRDMVPDDEFVKDVKAAVTDTYPGSKQYEALIKILDEWGWYVPVQITLGGTIYATDTKTFKGAVIFHDVEISDLRKIFEDKIEEFKSAGEDSTKQVVLYKMGGAIIGKDDFYDWRNLLENARTWEIITYSQVWPSLLLLRKVNNGIMQECIRVLKEHGDEKTESIRKHFSPMFYGYHMQDLNERRGYAYMIPSE